MHFLVHYMCAINTGCRSLLWSRVVFPCPLLHFTCSEENSAIGEMKVESRVKEGERKRRETEERRGIQSVYGFSFICVPSSFLQPNLRLIPMEDITNWRPCTHHTSSLPGLQLFVMYRGTASTALPLHTDLPQRSCGLWWVH